MDAAASERLNMSDIGKIEYRVRPITRYIVTRFHESASGNAGGSSQCGEYDNEDIAYEVGYALCRAEHTKLGWPPGDMRIIYPDKPAQKATMFVCAGGSTHTVMI